MTVLDNRLHLVCGVLLTSADTRWISQHTHRDEPDSLRSFLLRQINFNPSNPRVYVQRCARPRKCGWLALSLWAAAACRREFSLDSFNFLA